MPAVLCLICGVPGSGKTTLLTSLAERIQDSQAFALDDNLKSPGSNAAFDSHEWKKAHQKLREDVSNALQKHRGSTHTAFVFVEDVCHLRSMRKAFIKIAEAHEAKVGVIRCYAPLDICLSRVASRLVVSNKASRSLSASINAVTGVIVPPPVIEKLFAQFEWPNSSAPGSKLACADPDTPPGNEVNPPGRESLLHYDEISPSHSSATLKTDHEDIRGSVDSVRAFLATLLSQQAADSSTHQLTADRERLDRTVKQELSLLHRLDILLRKEVSVITAQQQHRSASRHTQVIAAKKAILERARIQTNTEMTEDEYLEYFINAFRVALN